jgi:hypothetical protein
MKQTHETVVINENYYYFIAVYNQQHILLTFYNILNIANYN